MPVVGTAGHVDHGKSTLVQALTGRDPDRWAEEKARGLTIDLGFAWGELPGGVEVSFVDVPGHERFIKNMLAGVEAIDVALFVVAADEGWMPQSEEHLAVLDLLGVTRAVVALTKVDRVDDDLAELATLEVREHLEGTGLAGSPILRVAAPSGDGVAALAEALAAQVADLPTAPSGRPRLWVDRSFTISGAGTVVTGTLLGGTLRIGDRVSLWPEGVEARIRGLQTHEREVTEAAPRARVAVNLAGVDRHRIERGAMIGAPGAWQTTTRFTAVLRTARYVERISDRGAYHLHVGSGAMPIRLRLLEALEGGSLATIEIPRPICLEMGDRFILREVGRRAVVGGGRVLDPGAPSRRAEALRRGRLLLSALDEAPDTRAARLLAARGKERLDVLAAHSGGGTPTGAMQSGATALSADAAETLERRAVELVTAFHRESPLRPGMPLASLASRLALEPGLLEVVLAGSEEVHVAGAVAALVHHVGERTPEQSAAWETARRRLDEAGLSVPRLTELDLDEELVHSLVREGQLVRVSTDLVYLSEQIARVTEAIRSLPPTFSVAEFKDALGISRKYAVPLLEWADSAAITVRSGDRRRRRD